MTEQSKEQIRGRMLTLARINKAQFTDGFVPAPMFAAVKDDQGAACPDEATASELLGELVSWGLLDEAQSEELGGVKPSFKHRRFRFTKKGRALWLGEISPIPGVEI